MNQLRPLLLCSFILFLLVPNTHAQTLHVFSPPPLPPEEDDVGLSHSEGYINRMNIKRMNLSQGQIDTLHAQARESLRASLKEVKVKLFADGNTKTVLTGADQDTEETTTNGSIGLIFERGDPFFTVSGLVNVAAAEDTLTAGFGQSLLTPGTGNLGGVLELLLPFPGELLGRNFIVHFYSSVSSNTWKHEDISADLVVVGAGALLAYDLGKSIKDAFYGLRVEGGLAYRGLYGDAASNGSFREEALGTDARRFLGLEAGISLTARNLTAGITFYRFFTSSEKNVPGFSDGQLAGGISISTAIPLND